MNRYLVHAQHCDGPFYMGWWLYCDPVAEDGKVYHDRRFLHHGGGWWMKWDNQQARAAELASRHGVTLPDPMRYSDRTAEAFASAFPCGIWVHGEQADRFALDGSEVNCDVSVLSGWPYPQELES